MTLSDGVWTLQRLADPPDFCQRFTATVADDTIDGRWESSPDGTTWSPDFALTYSRLR
jgi:hypothetical protein